MSTKILIAVATVVAMGGCATTQGPASTTPAKSNAQSASAAPSADTRIVKSRDGKFDGEMVGTAAPGSKFAKLQIGMEFNEVTQLIGGPASMDSHETGKRWIPFYFGNDARRMEVQYPGEGCLTFTAGNVWGGGGNELIRITADPTGAKCKDS